MNINTMYQVLFEVIRNYYLEFRRYIRNICSKEILLLLIYHTNVNKILSIIQYRSFKHLTDRHI